MLLKMELSPEFTPLGRSVVNRLKDSAELNIKSSKQWRKQTNLFQQRLFLPILFLQRPLSNSTICPQNKGMHIQNINKGTIYLLLVPEELENLI